MRARRYRRGYRLNPKRAELELDGVERCGAAQQAMQIIVGVDVCKERLEVFEQCSERAYSIDNDAAAIAAG